MISISRAACLAVCAAILVLAGCGGGGGGGAQPAPSGPVTIAADGVVLRGAVTAQAGDDPAVLVTVDGTTTPATLNPAKTTWEKTVDFGGASSKQATIELKVGGVGGTTTSRQTVTITR